MALINCTTCGRQISDRASVCPYCGQPAANYVPPQMPAQPTQQPYAPAMQPAPAAKSKPPVIIAVTVVIVALIAAAVVLIINLTKSGDGSKGSDPTSLPAANSMLVISGAESGDSCVLHLKVNVENNLIVAKYLVDVYLDGTLLATLDDSTTYDQELTVTKGVHTITFKNNEKPDDAAYTCEVSETVTKNTGISYSLKRNTEKGGLIDHITGIEIRDRQYF